MKHCGVCPFHVRPQRPAAQTAPGGFPMVRFGMVACVLWIATFAAGERAIQAAPAAPAAPGTPAPAGVVPILAKRSRGARLVSPVLGPLALPPSFAKSPVVPVVPL